MKRASEALQNKFRTYKIKTLGGGDEMRGFCNFTLAVILTLITAAIASAQSQNGGRRETLPDAVGQQTEPQTPRQTRPQQQRPGVTPVPPLSEEDAKRLEAARQRRQREATTGDPDVLLDIPNVTVQEITLEVDNLFAHLSLDARLANLLQLTAGVDVKIDKVKLTIKGVRAEALLKVKLNNVAEIIDRTLTTIDRNPELLERLLQTVDKTVGTVGQTLNNITQPGGLLSQTVNTLGQTVQRTLDTTGNIVERTLDNTGKLLNEKSIGNISSLTNLTVVSETTNTAGQVLRRVKDASGAVIELTLDTAGKIINSRVVSQATNR